MANDSYRKSPSNVSTYSSINDDSITKIDPITKDDSIVNVNMDELYQYVLRILILEYINQPKFQQSAAYSSTYKRNPPSAQNSLVMLNGPQIDQTNYNETRLVQGLKSDLKNYLYDVTIVVKKIDNVIFRRCLLKLNNDLFMNSAMESTVINMQKAEDLIVYFTKAANNELKKLSLDNTQEELYKQITNFVGLLIRLLPAGTSTDYIDKLKDYKSTMGFSNAQRRRQSRISSSPAAFHNEPYNVNSSTNVRKPTFKLQEIPHADYFTNLFAKDSLTVQQDVIKVINEATNFNACRDYTYLQSELNNDCASISRVHFKNDDDYHQWKYYQLGCINEFLTKFKTFGRAPDANNTKHLVIPANPRGFLMNLLILVLRVESINNQSSVSFSQSGTFFFFKVAKYWLQDYPTTLASILYSAANCAILNDEEVNLSLMENLYSVIKSKILKESIETINIESWNNIDKDIWLDNCGITAGQCFNAIDNLLSGLYSKTKPKFSPVLLFYYSSLEYYGIPFLDPKTVKRFRKTIFKTSEQYYRELLMGLPRDGTLEIKNFQNICELLIKEIQTIQKKYTKPLLDKINIAVECAKMLTSAISVDAPLMLKQIQHTAKVEKKSILPVDALELYSVLKEIRDIFLQIHPKERFSFNMEKTFGKYLIRFAKDVSKKVDATFINALKLEEWKPLSDDVLYSSSVHDIFKMVNESINVFNNFDWDYNYTYAYSVTLVLKAISDGIQNYCGYITDIVQKSLREGAEDINSPSPSLDLADSSNKRKSKWDFHELKNAIISSSEVHIPKPYKFEKVVCTILNNIDMMISLLEKLESSLDSTQLSTIINEQRDLSNKKEKSEYVSHQLYTVRVKSAHDIKGYSSNGLSNSSVSVIYSERRKCIGETIVYPNSNDPVWDQEFELAIEANKQATLVFNVFHSPGRFKLVRKNELCGKASILLSPKQFVDDGFPTPKTLPLDTRGEIDIEITLENEKLDPLFCMGKSYRTLSRARDRILDLMVNKFTPFVDYAFSKEILKTICGSNGNIVPLNDDVYDSIIPLFDYLNANLNVLAQSLTQELLFMVMLKAWNTLLRTADNLLLPQLDIAKNKLAHAKKALWNIGNTSSILGYGRPLTKNEVEAVFKWLDALCVDFFYNNGEGPPLDSLQSADYQNLLLIPKYYNKAAMELKKEVGQLSPIYYKHITHMTDVSEVEVSRHLTTIQRRKTIMANSSKAKRLQYEKELHLTEESNEEKSLATLNIILRILISKGEIDYVYRHLHERKQKIKQINVANLVNQVSQGKKIHYKTHS